MHILVMTKGDGSPEVIVGRAKQQVLATGMQCMQAQGGKWTCDLYQTVKPLGFQADFAQFLERWPGPSP